MTGSAKLRGLIAAPYTLEVARPVQGTNYTVGIADLVTAIPSAGAATIMLFAFLSFLYFSGSCSFS